MTQSIERGLLISFDNASYTATVQLVDALSTQLSFVPIATHVDGSSAQIGSLCIVVFLDEQNSDDACIIAIFPSGGVGFPAPPPGRVTFVATHLQISGAAITSGSTNTYTVTGVGGIPTGALGVLVKCVAVSSTVGAFLGLCDHGGDIANTFVVGNQQVASQSMNQNAMLPVSTAGQIDIKANGGNFTVTLYTYGYIW